MNCVPASSDVGVVPNASVPDPVLVIVRAIPPSSTAPSVSRVVVETDGLATLKVGLPESVVAPKVKPSVPDNTRLFDATFSVAPLNASVPSVCVTPAFDVTRVTLIVPPDGIELGCVKVLLPSNRNSSVPPPKVRAFEALPSAELLSAANVPWLIA